MAIHAHELSHQWFGNLVTPKWWDDFWLNEAFATWMGYKAAHAFRPDLELGRVLLRRAHYAMQIDARPSVRAIREPVTGSDDMHSVFHSLAYAKGGAIMGMLEHYLGEAVFKRGIQLHLDRFANSNADAFDFSDSLTLASGNLRLRDTFEDFVTQPGVPLVSAEINCDGPSPSLTFQQSRYQHLGNPSPDQTSWQIPVCWSLPHDQQCRLLDEDPLEIKLASCPDWVMPNTGGSGYYRFSLSAQYWKKLLRAMPDLPPEDAFAIVDNVLAELHAGTLTFPVLDFAFQQASNRTEWDIASIPIREFSWLRRTLLGEHDDAYAAWVHDIASPVLERIQNSGTQIVTPSNTILHELALEAMAQEARDPDIRQQLDAAARAYLTNDLNQIDINALPPDRIRLALTVAVQEHGNTLVHEMTEKMAHVNHPDYRRFAGSAIGRGANAEVGAWIRDTWLLSPGLRSSEVEGMLNILMYNPKTRDDTWLWIQQNFAALLQRFPDTGAGKLIEATGGFCTLEKHHQVKSFFQDRLDHIPGGKKILTNALERIDQCVAYRKALAEPFQRWLQQRRVNATTVGRQ